MWNLLKIFYPKYYLRFGSCLLMLSYALKNHRVLEWWSIKLIFFDCLTLCFSVWICYLALFPLISFPYKFVVSSSAAGSVVGLRCWRLGEEESSSCAIYSVGCLRWEVSIWCQMRRIGRIYSLFLGVGHLFHFLLGARSLFSLAWLRYLLSRPKLCLFFSFIFDLSRVALIPCIVRELR